MSAKTLEELAMLFNQREPIPVERYFTENFLFGWCWRGSQGHTALKQCSTTCYRRR
jgi:hypothetical protein